MWPIDSESAEGRPGRARRNDAGTGRTLAWIGHRFGMDRGRIGPEFFWPRMSTMMKMVVDQTCHERCRFRAAARPATGTAESIRCVCSSMKDFSRCPVRTRRASAYSALIRSSYQGLLEAEEEVGKGDGPPIGAVDDHERHWNSQGPPERWRFVYGIGL